MRSYDAVERTANETAARPFSIQSKAVDRSLPVKMTAILVLALLTMIAAGMMSMHPSSASQAEDLTSPATQGLAASKSDRATAVPSNEACKSQAWGAWSEDCAASLSGAARVRNVSFVTIEKSSPTVNETILYRYPVTN